jgi:hypothetical protein
VSRVDQLAFGYDEGHRLLIASREVPRALLVRLLVATDTVMNEGTPPLITGLALPETDQFAFCVTWSDTRAKRAGAVCSHVLLTDAVALSHPRAVDMLVRLPRDPSCGGLEHFATPLALTADARGIYPELLAGDPPRREVVERCLQVACRTGGAGIVLHPDLAEAAHAIISVWSAMWPALRAHFSFRTRALATAETSDWMLTAAPRLSGGSGLIESVERPTASWLVELTSAVATPSSDALLAFIESFGPYEEPMPLRMRRLAEVWTAVTLEDVEGAMECIETHWSAPQDGAALKRALFGEHARDWWSVGERERVSALLGTRHPTWDLVELDLTGRVRKLARSAQAG